MLHSAVMGTVLYVWAKSSRLPSGRAKRRLLMLLLVLPLVTAAVPGRTSVEFRGRLAWFDSARLLAIELPAGLHVYHIALAVVALAVVLTVWQEIMPALGRRPASSGKVPETLATAARALPGWHRCRVLWTDTDEILVATSGWPHRPTLVISRGALAELAPDELDAVVRHEHAHWREGRWARSHLLFLVRVLQAFNPVALWSFREFCLEVEAECDAAAVAGRDPKPLARTLLKVYEDTDTGDLAARSALRRRIDLLVHGAPGDEAVPPMTVAIIAVVLCLVLPWIV